MAWQQGVSRLRVAQDAAKQFAGDLRPWATPLQGRDELSPDDWRQARSWGSRLSPAEIGQAAQQVHS